MSRRLYFLASSVSRITPIWALALFFHDPTIPGTHIRRTIAGTGWSVF